MSQKAWWLECKASHMALASRKQREGDTGAHVSSSYLFQSEKSGPGMVLPKHTVDLPPQFNLSGEDFTEEHRSVFSRGHQIQLSNNEG